MKFLNSNIQLQLDGRATTHQQWLKKHRGFGSELKVQFFD